MQTTTTGRAGQPYATPLSSMPDRFMISPPHAWCSPGLSGDPTGGDQPLEPGELLARAEGEKLVALREDEVSGRAHERIAVAEDGEDGRSRDPANVEGVEGPADHRAI